MEYENLPGVVLTLVSVTGGSGPGGNFMPGDTIRVNFTVTDGAGNAMDFSKMDSTAAWFSGPTFNYQKLLPAYPGYYYTDPKTVAVRQSDGSWTYTFPAPIPTTYAAPRNDSSNWTDGEVTGQNLLDGTYTVCLRAYKYYYVGEAGTRLRDVAHIAQDVLLGSNPGALTARAVVSDAHCNSCHVQVQMHGGSYRSTRLCVTCHTAGSEDGYTGSNETIEFKVMIHRLHNGEHLPSVNGKTNNGTTGPVYGTGTPIKVGGSSPYDFSEVGFPVWPSMNNSMPRDAGYSALTAAEKTAETAVLRGVVNCATCHGTGNDGSLTAPAQGNNYLVPERNACGSCHDDVNFAASYVMNGQTMGAQSSNANCAQSGCHTNSGTALSVQDAHTHPIVNTTTNPGLNFNVTALTEVNGTGTSGTMDAGDSLSVSFTVKDDAGVDATPSTAVGGGLYFAIRGPTTNNNFVHYFSGNADGAMAGTGTGTPATYTINVPTWVHYEYLGTAPNVGAGTTFGAVANTPHATVTPVVMQAVTTGASTTTSTATAVGAWYIEVANASGFARNDYIVIDAGGTQEYRRLYGVDTTVTPNRLNFGSTYRAGSYDGYPRASLAHASGVSVAEVTMTVMTAGAAADYTWNAGTGVVTVPTTHSFSAGNPPVVICYGIDWVFPATYPDAIEDSPNSLTETDGKWSGYNLVNGTYTLGLWGYRSLSVTLQSETQTYRGASPAALKDFIFDGGVTNPRQTDLTSTVALGIISSQNNCNTCHARVLFHGSGRRDANTCLMCHGTSGMEDHPLYRDPTGPATNGVSAAFREMVHKIHRGADLANPSTNQVNGADWSKIHFPAFPDGVKDCSKCHGSSTAWKAPADRNHPTQQVNPATSWKKVCTSCHDASYVLGHVALMTSSGGVESCGICHGTNKPYDVSKMHKVR